MRRGSWARVAAERLLDFAAQLKTASRNLRSYSTVRSDTGLPLGPTFPARRAPMNRSQSRWESVAGFRCLPKNPRNIFVATRSYLREPLTLGGRGRTCENAHGPAPAPSLRAGGSLPSTPTLPSAAPAADGNRRNSMRAHGMGASDTCARI